MELRDYLRILRKRRWAVVIALLACLAGAAVATVMSTPVYEARAKLFVGQRQIATTEVSQGYQLTQLSQQLLKSYATVIRLRSIAERAVERESLPISPQEVARNIRSEPILETQLIDLSYQSVDAALAQRIVNAVAEAFVDEVERFETPKAPNAEPAVRVSIVEPALQPLSPVRPRPVRTMALALVLGVVVGVGLAFVTEYFDTTVKGAHDVEEAAGTSVLAAVPRLKTTAGSVYLERDPQSGAAEAFRKLRTAIQFLGVDHPVQTILITSSFAQEGKTTTALNLAAAFANAGMRTILLEADLRRPTLHKVFKSEGQRGLTTVLIGRVPLDQALIRTNIRNLSVMPAGAVPPNPAELLASAHMADVLRTLQTKADVVIVDAAPLLPVADTSALAPRVDGVIIVARAGMTHRDRLRDSAGLVARTGGRVLGVSLNAIRPEDSQYGYYYEGYGYRSDSVVQPASLPEPRAGTPNGSQAAAPAAGEQAGPN